MHRNSALAILLAAAFASGCEGSDAPPAADGGAAPADAPLSAVELEQGIGPIRDLTLGPVDATLAETGRVAFLTKCSACHKVEEQYVAPMLGDVLERRRPEYVMNMILNAAEMVQRHPEAKALLSEFYTPMPVQVTDPDEARAILEYLRSAQITSQ